MSDSRRKKQPSPPPHSDIRGEPPEAAYDRELKAGPTPPAADPDRIALPRGALVAMRRSGGLMFRSREVVVYRDGRVSYDDGGGGGPRTVWMLSDAELAELRGALEQIDFAHMPASTGRQNPDAFAYEIAARPQRRAYAIEAFQGSIPPALAPLIEQLNRLASLEGGDF